LLPFSSAKTAKRKPNIQGKKGKKKKLRSEHINYRQATTRKAKS